MLSVLEPVKSKITVIGDSLSGEGLFSSDGTSSVSSSGRRKKGGDKLHQASLTRTLMASSRDLPSLLSSQKPCLLFPTQAVWGHRFLYRYSTDTLMCTHILTCVLSPCTAVDYFTSWLEDSLPTCNTFCTHCSNVSKYEILHKAYFGTSFYVSKIGGEFILSKNYVWM